MNKLNVANYRDLVNEIKLMELADKIEALNEIRSILHDISPFKDEPVDFVRWVVNNDVVANDYNPNKVAPPEMELLEVSIMNDGYTQPIVTFPHDGKVEVIDGFHRSRVGKESKIVMNRVNSYLPTVIIRKDNQGKSERIASTIRHNRARGKHQIDAMSDIVIELKNRNWSNTRIANQLGMDEDEILRLCQITGLQELFKDDDFSRAWESSDSVAEYEELTDILSEDEREGFYSVNTNDPGRIFHTYDKWECHKAGFYATTKDGMTEDQCKNEYYTILSDSELFASILEKIIVEWKYSCEHYLTNKSMNRIAWLGQAAVCYHSGVPSKYSAGWNLLSKEQQAEANDVALTYMNKWMSENKFEVVDIDEAESLNRQINIY